MTVIANQPALICDTGALLDYFIKGSPDHESFRDVIDAARTRYVPGLVLAEVDYSLRRQRPAMKIVMEDLASGAFTYAPPSLAQLARALEIDQRYADLALGLVDASIVALAEVLGVVASRPEIFDISQQFDSATVAHSTWSYIPRVQTNPDPEDEGFAIPRFEGAMA